MKKALKIFFTAILLIIIGLIIVRIGIMQDKSAFDDFKITEKSAAAYAEKGDLTVRTLKLKDKISSSGLFCAYSMYYVEETGELQVTVRYNNRSLDGIDIENEEQLSFTLFEHEADKESESSADAEEDEIKFYSDGNYYEPVSVETKTKYGLYSFRKLIFEDIELTEEKMNNYDLLVVMESAEAKKSDNTEEISDKNLSGTLARYESLKEKAKKNGGKLGCQYIHYAEQPVKDYKLSRSDISDLKSFSEN